MNTNVKRSMAGATFAIAALVGSSLGATPAFAQGAVSATGTAQSQAPVRALQEALNRQGIPVAADGILSDATRDAIRQYQSQHHLPVTGEPDQATLAKLGLSATPSAAVEPPASTAATPGAADRSPMPGGPGRGEMADRRAGPGGMPGMMGGAQGGGPGGMPGRMGGGQGGGSGGMPGRMGDGQGGMPGMMGGMSMCPMMQGMSRHGQPSMAAMAGGMNLIYGVPRMPHPEMTPERVRTLLEQQLAGLANPRLKLGTVASAPDGSITAEILTVDDSLVQKLAFNRYPGLVRQVTE